MTNIRRGMFRVWIVTTTVTILGVSLYLLRLKDPWIVSACFEVTAAKLADGSAAFDHYPVTICTASYIKEPLKTSFETRWQSYTRIDVEFAPGDVSSIVPANLNAEEYGYLSLYSMADARQWRSNFMTKLQAIGFVDVAILIIAIAVWWLGRLSAYLLWWIRRGFAEQHSK